jgi:hypothetical protein
MKKQIFTLLLSSALLSTQAQVTRKVLMEEYTGTWCPNCPDGHDTIKKLLLDHPGRLVVVGMHNNDAYTIPYETAMETAMQVTGFPRATIDRDSFPTANYFAMSRWFWTDAVADRLNVTSPVEIKLTPSLNGSTRLLTVKVDYTFKAAVNEETRLTCVLLEDSILAAQSGATGTYVHKDVSRALLSADNWGDANNPTMVSANQSFSKTYTYTLPATWNANNMTVVAFINKKMGATPIISQGTEVLNAEEAFIGFPTATSDVADNQFSVGECYPNPSSQITALDFTLDKDADVKAYVTDIRGAVVKNLSDSKRSAGKHSIYWAGTDQQSNRMNAGMYLIHLSINGKVYTRKVILE